MSQPLRVDRQVHHHAVHGLRQASWVLLQELQLGQQVTCGLLHGHFLHRRLLHPQSPVSQAFQASSQVLSVSSGDVDRCHHLHLPHHCLHLVGQEVGPANVRTAGSRCREDVVLVEDPRPSAHCEVTSMNMPTSHCPGSTPASPLCRRSLPCVFEAPELQSASECSRPHHPGGRSRSSQAKAS